MTTENAAAMGKARVFQCPKCGEYINTHMTECRFCHAPVDAQQAQTAATQLNQANEVEEERNDAPRNMLVGGLFCVGGIVVTAITYSAAASGSTGGHYVIAWGAIVFGAVQFFKGLYHTLSK